MSISNGAEHHHDNRNTNDQDNPAPLPTGFLTCSHASRTHGSGRALGVAAALADQAASQRTIGSESGAAAVLARARHEGVPDLEKLLLIYRSDLGFSQVHVDVRRQTFI